jgi:hypothetical protein
MAPRRCPWLARRHQLGLPTSTPPRCRRLGAWDCQRRIRARDWAWLTVVVVVARSDDQDELDESADEDDRPLTREELKMRTLRAVLLLLMLVLSLVPVSLAVVAERSNGFRDAALRPTQDRQHSIGQAEREDAVRTETPVDTGGWGGGESDCVCFMKARWINYMAALISKPNFHNPQTCLSLCSGARSSRRKHSWCRHNQSRVQPITGRGRRSLWRRGR